MKKLMFLMLFVSLLSFGMAQNVEINAGQTTVAPIETVNLDAETSSVLGGLISSLVNTKTVQRWIDFTGINVWFSEQTTTEPVLDFELYAFPTDTIIGWDSITTGDMFETSEVVTIGDCVDCSWETYVTKFDEYTLMEEGVNLTFDDGDKLAFLDGAGNPSYEWYNAETGLCGSGYAVSIGVDSPTNEEMSALTGFDVTDVKSVVIPEIDETIIAISHDLTFDFMATLLADKGYEVNAQSGQTLMIAPSGTYDIYSVVPAV